MGERDYSGLNADAVSAISIGSPIQGASPADFCFEISSDLAYLQATGAGSAVISSFSIMRRCSDRKRGGGTRRYGNDNLRNIYFEIYFVLYFLVGTRNSGGLLGIRIRVREDLFNIGILSTKLMGRRATKYPE